MIKAYLIMRNSEPLTTDDIFMVSNKKDAEKIIKNLHSASYYETIPIYNSKEVDDFLKEIARG